MGKSSLAAGWERTMPRKCHANIFASHLTWHLRHQLIGTSRYPKIHWICPPTGDVGKTSGVAAAPKIRFFARSNLSVFQRCPGDAAVVGEHLASSRTISAVARWLLEVTITCIVRHRECVTAHRALLCPLSHLINIERLALSFY